MNPVFDLGQFLGNQTNYGFDQLTSNPSHYSDSHGFLASQELIFGNSSSGTANLFDRQQMNTAPMLFASSYMDD